MTAKPPCKASNGCNNGREHYDEIERVAHEERPDTARGWDSHVSIIAGFSPPQLKGAHCPAWRRYTWRPQPLHVCWTVRTGPLPKYGGWCRAIRLDEEHKANYVPFPFAYRRGMQNGSQICRRSAGFGFVELVPGHGSHLGAGARGSLGGIGRTSVGRIELLGTTAPPILGRARIVRDHGLTASQ